MEPFQIVLTVVLVVLVIVVSVVGIQMILVLAEARKTLRNVNNTIDALQEKVTNFTHPFQNLGGTLQGIKTGMQFFEAFTSWLNKGKK